jgi:hypothetical protein
MKYGSSEQIAIVQAAAVVLCVMAEYKTVG